MFFIKNVLKFKNNPGHLKVNSIEIKKVPVSDLKGVSLSYAALVTLLCIFSALH